jgi:hypothetical protein
MTLGRTDWVIALATGSAICEIWGTITVWLSYQRSARFSDDLSKLIRDARIKDNPPLDSKERLVKDLARWADPIDLEMVRDQSRSSMLALLENFRKRWWITTGLTGYILGAILGLIAVVVGVS